MREYSWALVFEYERLMCAGVDVDEYEGPGAPPQWCFLRKTPQLITTTFQFAKSLVRRKENIPSQLESDMLQVQE